MTVIHNVETMTDNSTRSVAVDNRALLLVKRAGELYLYDNLCPHTGDTLDPNGGSVASANGMLLQCQRHAAEFISETGACVSGPCQGEQLNAVPFTLSGADIYLE